MALSHAAAFVWLASAVVVGCGSDDAPNASSSSTAVESATGLECAEEPERLLEYDVDLAQPGAATEPEAAAAALTYYVDQHGGETVTIRSDTYGLDVGGRVVVVADVTPAPAGGFRVTTVHACDSFVPVETGPPETAAPVTSAP